MTDDLIKLLMSVGLNKQQASSVTAETITNLYMNDDGKILIAEAKRQVQEMNKLVLILQEDYLDLKKKINALSDILASINEAQNKYGEINDEKAKNAVALYGALLTMNEKTGTSADEAVRSASFITYACLGGQAKREISYVTDK